MKSRVPSITQAFTCTGPYAMLIFSGVKRVENRSMLPAPACGRCAISVSKSFSQKEYANFIDWAHRAFGLPWCMLNLWDWQEVRRWRGCIIGAADYAAVTAIPEDEALRHQCASWNEGYGAWWILSHVQLFREPLPCRGNVGMWYLPADLALRVQAADGGQISP